MEQEPYTITRIEPAAAEGPGGNLVDGYRVMFRTREGITAYVNVPRSEQLEEEVHRAVARESAKLDTTLKRKPIRLNPVP